MLFGRKKKALQLAADSVPFWFHSIDLGRGVTTNGRKSAADLAAELEALSLPPLAEKSMLDIGAWDGYFSFAAERRGARRVVSLDHYVWCMDLPAQNAYWRQCQESGQVPEPYERIPAIWRPEELPGKRGFDTAREAMSSRVESRVADFMTDDLAGLGTFDVVLFKGVLYHMEEPLASLKRVAELASQLAVVETAAVRVPGFEDARLCEFYESDELSGDPSNWWAPSEPALHGLCRVAGFARVETRFVGPVLESASPDGAERYRIVVHAWK